MRSLHILSLLPVIVYGQLSIDVSVDLSGNLADSVVFPFSPGFDIKAVTALAVSLPSHSWEYGTAVEALLELYTPELSVFGPAPFPVGAHSPNVVPGLEYAQEKIVIGTGVNALSDGDGAVGDPASLGVGAVMLGKTNATFNQPAFEEVEYMIKSAPRWFNGAISHRADVPELWADFVYMAPPFLAFYAADTDDEALLKVSVEQCGFYRQALQANLTNPDLVPGVWEHIVGPQSADHGLWSTGNAWAAAGMTRVLATVEKAPVALQADWKSAATANLTLWIKEIVTSAMSMPMEDGVLRNYLDNTSGDGHGFGEISGSSMLAAVAYRMAVLQPTEFGAEYIAFADDIRKVLGGNDSQGNPHVTEEGVVTPAVNPLGWQDTKPFTTGSPEGNGFTVLLYAAWRDCVLAGVCDQSGGLRKRSVRVPQNLRFTKN